MRSILIHQTLASFLSILLPYAIIFIGDVDWHLEYSRLMIYILFARSLMYNSYTSIFTESTRVYGDNSTIKYLVLLFIVIFISLISKGLFKNPVYLVALVSAILFEDFRRKELYYGKTVVLNVSLVFIFLFLLFAGSNPIFLLLLSIMWLALSLQKTEFRGSPMGLIDVKKRLSYILMAIFGFAIGGGYLDKAAIVLDAEEFQELRYVLFIFAPISFISQLAEYLWFSDVFNRSRRLLLSVTFIIDIISILFIASLIYNIVHPQKALLVVIVINALLISANSLLRIVLRSIKAYNFLFFVVLLGSLPYLFMWFSDSTTIYEIYTYMTAGLFLMFITLLFRTVKMYKANRILEGSK